MTTTSYRGVWPVAPTPFHDTGEIDLDGMRRVLDCMIDQGVRRHLHSGQLLRAVSDFG